MNRHPRDRLQGQDVPNAPPTEFARFDTKRAFIDRLKLQILATRDKAIRKRRYLTNRS